MTTTIALRGVSKQYGDVLALDDVSIGVRAGSVHAVVGENGAGKSTAMRILAGLEQPTLGTAELDGLAVRIGSRSDGIARGIGLVPQQLSLNGEMDLVDNLILTQPARIARRRRAAVQLEDAAREAGLTLDPRTPVRLLDFSQRQLGELAIALAQGARILLLDEPTSALGPYETAALFQRVRLLADGGVAVVLITHRIAEVREVADDVTVLSHGRVTLASAVADVTDDELVRAMVGELPTPEPRSRAVAGDDVLVLEGVTVATSGVVALDDVSLTVRAGEIVGVLGVAGNGQGALAEAAAGIVRLAAGSVQVAGRSVGGRPQVARAAGVAYVPEVRADFLLPDATVLRSSVLRRVDDPAFSRFGVLRWSLIRDFAQGLLERHDVRPRQTRLRTGALSGGNQQKLLVGRELDGSPRVAVLHGPTQGLDLNAAAAIRREIRAAADDGTAVLLLSADIDEVHQIADRVVVLSHGRVADAFPIAQFESERVGRAMAGLTEGSR